jgi:hypothetical protein
MTKRNPWIQFYDYGPKVQGWGYSGVGWYFWDESETYAYGPYTSKEMAAKGMQKYARSLNDVNSTPVSG